MKYLEIAGVALALFVAMRVLYRYLPVISGKWRIKSALLRFIPLIELILWFLFILWAPGRLFVESDLFIIIRGAMAIMLIALIGWYLLRDFVSGAILRIETPFERGSQIISPYAEGEIKKLGFRSAEIITPKGESVRVPYSLLSKNCITRPSDNPKRVEHVIKMSFHSDKQAGELKESIKRALLTMPWIIAEDQIRIEITKENSSSPSAAALPSAALPSAALPSAIPGPATVVVSPTSVGKAIYHAEIHFHATSSSMAIKTREELEHCQSLM